MKRKSWEISLLLVATLFCCTIVSCGKDDEPPTSTTETEPGPAEESNPTDGSGNTVNGYEYVDLGLSVMWATCNVGASSPEEYGNYYAWGEIETKETYTESNCTTYEKKIEDFSGNPTYDAATANWGSPWRTPTVEETEELDENCSKEWTTFNGVYGMLVTSDINGNSIFLPAAGGRIGSSLDGTGEYGNYWDSTPYGVLTDGAFGLAFNSIVFLWWGGGERYIGMPIRPVTTETESGTVKEPDPVEEPDPTEDPDNIINGYEYVDLGLSVKWATCNVGASAPEDFGNYYSWGEIEPKEEYTNENCVTWWKYLGDIAGDAKYDAATANWGSPWRMPTADEMQELRDNCTLEWTTLNGVNGLLVISNKNDNNIFLPIAGWRVNSNFDNATGHYWSSTPDNEFLEDAYNFGVVRTSLIFGVEPRILGFSVRPVTD